jgi:hypothetical protein
MDRTRLPKIFQRLKKKKRNKLSRFKYLNLELMKPAVNLFSSFIIITVIVLFMKWRILQRVHIAGGVKCYITHKHYVTFWKKNKIFYDGVFLNLNP